MEPIQCSLVQKMLMDKQDHDAVNLQLLPQDQDSHSQFDMEDSCGNINQSFKFETYNSFQNSQDLFSQPFLLAQLKYSNQQSSSLMQIQYSEVNTSNSQKPIQNILQSDKSKEKPKKTKAIKKDQKKKNKNKKEKLYNTKSNKRKRISKPRGNNTNNEPKIFGAIVQKVLKKCLKLEKKLDQGRYSYTARYYLHCAFSLVQGEKCVSKFFQQLDAGVQRKSNSRIQKGKETDFLNNFRKSIETLKQYCEDGNIERLRDSFKIIYNHNTDDSDDLQSYDSTLVQGYQKVKQIRQIYGLPNFFE